MASKTGRRVLLVEDDPSIAMAVEETLQCMGVHVLVDLSLVNALSELESTEFDAALVDPQLRGESAHPVILALLRRRVPFALISGGDCTTLGAGLPLVPVVRPPLDAKSLEKTVKGLLRIPPASHRTAVARAPRPQG